MRGFFLFAPIALVLACTTSVSGPGGAGGSAGSGGSGGTTDVGGAPLTGGVGGWATCTYTVPPCQPNQCGAQAYCGGEYDCGSCEAGTCVAGKCQ